MLLDPGAALLLLMTISAVGMLIVRLLKAGKKGLAALKLEALYLALYCFMVGGLFFFVLTKKDSDLGEPIWILMLSVVFISGFVLRVYALFRMISQVVGGSGPDKQ